MVNNNWWPDDWIAPEEFYFCSGCFVYLAGRNYVFKARNALCAACSSNNLDLALKTHSELDYIRNQIASIRETLGWPAKFWLTDQKLMNKICSQYGLPLVKVNNKVYDNVDCVKSYLGSKYI